jgi:hypothetical protein
MNWREALARATIGFLAGVLGLEIVRPALQWMVEGWNG